MVCSTHLRLAACAPALLAAAGALGQDDDAAFDRTPEDCIIVSNIDQTEAIDDHTIIFEMRGRRVYRNTLPRECPGLERENRIGFETRTSRLCSTDTITVLEDFGGFGGGVGVGGLRRGFTCRLGEFVPMSPADIEELELLKEGATEQRAVETTSIELPDEEPVDEPPAAAEDAAPAEED
jgi:hypothetical protein